MRNVTSNSLGGCNTASNVLILPLNEFTSIADALAASRSTTLLLLFLLFLEDFKVNQVDLGCLR